MDVKLAFRVLKLYLIAIDSSGEPEKPNKRFDITDPNRLFVVSSVIIHETSFFELNEKIKQLKMKYFSDTDFEIHLKELTNRGKMRRLGYEMDTIADFLKGLYSIISDTEDLVIIAIAVEKSLPSVKISRKEYKKKLLEIATQLLIERITLYFDKINLYNRKEFALIKIDRSYYRENELLKESILKELKEGFYTSRRPSKDRLINEPMFLDSRRDTLIQIADAVAFCIRRKFTKPEKYPFNFSDFYDKIKKRFDRCRYNLEKIEGCGLKKWVFTVT